jgi:hypothetical protein
MPISLPQKASLAAHRLPPRTILACTRPILVGHAVELATAHHLPTTTARSKPTPRLTQHRLRQPRAPGADSARPPAGHGRSRRPRRLRPSQPYGCLPTAALHDLTSAGHSARGRTDTGRRTADTWTLRRPHRTLDSGRMDRQAWTLVAHTGHRTPDAGRGRGQGDQGAAGIPDFPSHHAERPHAGTPNRVPVDSACGARQPMQARRGGRLPARDSLSPAAAWSLRRGRAAPRRTAVLGRISGRA